MSQTTLSTCICGLHFSTNVSASSKLGRHQEAELSSTIPPRREGVFPVENHDPTLSLSVPDPCLDTALNSVAYWLENSTTFQKKLAYLVADYDIADKPNFTDWLSDKGNPHLLPVLHTFLRSRPLPTIRLMADLKTKFDQDVDLYGAFDPDQSNIIYINSGLVKTAKASPRNSLSLTFLLFAKIIHELSHWITHWTMKNQVKAPTPTEFFNGEAGNFVEQQVFGCLVTHHSGSVSCQWDVELVVKDRIPGSGQADYFNIKYMSQFFDKKVVDLCEPLYTLRSGTYTTSMTHRTLASVTPISLDDELVRPVNPKYQGHLTSITLPKSEGIQFKLTRDVVTRKRDPGI